MAPVQVERKVIIPHKEAHPTSINTIHFVPSENGENDLVATGSSDDTIRVWDLQGKELKIFIGHLAPITQIDFSVIDEKIFLASSSEDGTVKIWDYESGDILKNYIDATNIVKVVSFAFNKVLTGSKDKHFRIYDFSTDKLLFDLELGGITALAVHPTNHICVVGTTSNQLVIINIDKGEIIRKITAHELPIQGLDFSNDGKLLVSGSLNKQVKIWNVADNYTELVAFPAHSSAVTSAKFRPHKDSFMTSGFDRNAHFFQPGSLKPIKRFKGPKLAVTEISWDSKGDKIAICSADGSFRVFNMEDETTPILTVEATKDYISRLLFIQSKNTLVAGFANGSIHFYSTDTFSEEKIDEQTVFSDAHNSKITWLGLTTNNNLLSASEEKYIKLWDSESQELISASNSEESHTLGINDIGIYPNENWFLSVSKDTFIKKWQLPELTLLENYKTHKYAVNSICFSSDHEYVVTTSNDKRVVLHDKSMKELFTYRGHTDSVSCSVFSQENKYLFTGAKNGKIIIFDVQKEKEINSITLHTDEILKFQFSYDYKYLAIISADNHCSIFSYQVNENAFELKNIFLGLFSGNPTDIIWITKENDIPTLLITTLIGELIELTIKNE